MAAVSQLPLQIESTHARKVQVEHETTRRIGRVEGEKLLGAAIGPDEQVDRFEQPAQGAADRLLIVDDADDGLAGTHSLAGMQNWNVTP